MDFIDIMKLTEKESVKVAEEFSRMSGTDVLQAMVTQMEAAGVSSNKMSFALEGIASDTTDLIPLLINGGEALNSLTNEFDDLGITLTSIDVEKIREVGKEFDNFSKSFAAESRQLVADYSAEIIKALGVVSVFGEKSIDTLQVIAAGWGGLISVAQAALNDFVNGTSQLDTALAEASENSKEALRELLGEDFYQLGVDAGVLMAEGVADGMQETQGKTLKVFIKGGKQISDWEKLNKKERLDVEQKFLKAGSVLADTFFEDNKALKAGLIIADTAAGIMKALSTSSNIYEGFANAAVVAAMGVAQLSNVMSASKGGGTISGGGGSASASIPQQEQELIETATLDVTERGDEGTQEFRLIITDESGNTFLDGIANGLDERERQGR